MGSKQKKWRITKIANRARKNIEALEIKFREEVIEKFEHLQDNPFKNDIKKVEGKKNIYRGRIGDYRYYFRTSPQSRSIEILAFEHRGRVKKKTIKRLK
ncbi:MAG: type II toxin-antitoxin system RelE/ParE family toxin [Candidatus Aminicenantia bacterium]